MLLNISKPSIYPRSVFSSPPAHLQSPGEFSLIGQLIVYEMKLICMIDSQPAGPRFVPPTEAPYFTQASLRGDGVAGLDARREKAGTTHCLEGGLRSQLAPASERAWRNSPSIGWKARLSRPGLRPTLSSRPGFAQLHHDQQEPPSRFFSHTVLEIQIISFPEGPN